MDEEIERAISVLMAQIRPVIKPDEAMKVTQAALNLAHVQSLLLGATKERKPRGPSA